LQNGHLHLTDFGLSKDEVEDDKGATTFCGTPEYLAPEMLINRKTREGYGKSVDWCVWAVTLPFHPVVKCWCM
jgi:serine/threonine protein kinase